MARFRGTSTVDAFPFVQYLVGNLQVPSVNTIVTSGADSDHMFGIMSLVDVPFVNVMYLDEYIRASGISALVPSLFDE